MTRSRMASASVGTPIKSCHFGFLANACRAEKLARIRAALAVPEPERPAEPEDYRERCAQLTGNRMRRKPLGKTCKRKRRMNSSASNVIALDLTSGIFHLHCSPPLHKITKQFGRGHKRFATMLEFSDFEKNIRVFRVEGEPGGAQTRVRLGFINKRDFSIGEGITDLSAAERSDLDALIATYKEAAAAKDKAAMLVFPQTVRYVVEAALDAGTDFQRRLVQSALANGVRSMRRAEVAKSKLNAKQIGEAEGND